jgi:CheY-like chemotaxis protein/HPt (histidine-containing phosphotransfer) domain-containing protein
LGLTALSAGNNRSALELIHNHFENGQAMGAVIAKDHAPSIDALALKACILNMGVPDKIPVILVTNLKQKVQHDGSAEAGFEGVLTKPVSIKRLEATLGPIFGHRGKGRGAATSGANEAVPEDAPIRSGHVLVADDYQTNQQVACMHLRAAGIRVDLADNGLQAVDAFRKNDYDLILMDIQMPELNGFDAAAAIRALEAESGRQRTPIIALTANAMKGVVHRCLDAGMDGYLTKPVRRAHLIETVDHWVARHNGGGNGHPLHRGPSTALDPDTDVIMDTETAVDEFGDAETVKLVAQQLIDNVERQLRTIRDSLTGRDRDRIRREAHAIKGGAATMEAVALSRCAAQLEKISPEDSIAALEIGCNALEEQFIRFREFISQWEEN